MALGLLVKATQADVVRLCRALGSTGEADDLVQECYLRIVRSLRSYRGESDVRAWMLAIVRNTCADHVRRRERERRLLDRLGERSSSVEADTAGETRALIDQLPAERREAFVLTQVLDLSYEEAARVVGCPVGTIRSRVSRAREDLIAMMYRSEAAG